MAILGWFGGSTMSSFVSEYASWIASDLLVFIGARMISRNPHGSKQRKISSLDLVCLN
jgi:putative Mn2+ efflux pump MntP